MIDFKEKNYVGYGIGLVKGKKEALENHTKTIKKDLNATKTNFFYLGKHLIDFYNSNAYSVIVYDEEQLRLELNIPIGYGNCCSAYFFAYCYDTFGLDKTQVSRYMNIVDEFGNEANDFDNAWDKFSYSQLCELLPLTEKQRKPVQPDWTIKKIREYKKSLVATSQQEQTELSDAEVPPNKYTRFEKWTKNELCDKIFELEAERETLLQELEKIRVSTSEYGGVA